MKEAQERVLIAGLNVYGVVHVRIKQVVGGWFGRARGRMREYPGAPAGKCLSLSAAQALRPHIGRSG